MIIFIYYVVWYNKFHEANYENKGIQHIHNIVNIQTSHICEHRCINVYLCPRVCFAQEFGKTKVADFLLRQCVGHVDSSITSYIVWWFDVHNFQDTQLYEYVYQQYGDKT